jgi:hypothetical protein
MCVCELFNYLKTIRFLEKCVERKMRVSFSSDSAEMHVSLHLKWLLNLSHLNES